MPIITECAQCGKQYRFGDERAGQKLPCKECGATIRVPSPRAAKPPAKPPQKSSRPAAAASSNSGYGDGDYGYSEPVYGSAYQQAPRRKSSGSGKLIAIIAIVCVVGLTTVAGGLFVLFTFFRGAGSGPTVASDSGTAAGGGASAGSSDGLSAEEKARRDAEYQALLAQQRVQSALTERDSLVRNYGQDKVVTIVFDDVQGDVDAANRYLQRKVFRASYADYKAGQDRANQQTEQNREAAEKQAVAQHQQTWGQGFGPMFVRYQYQQVESDVPYPQVINGGKDGTTYYFHAGPALNPQEFAQRLGVGQIVSVSGREIRIRSQLPVPIPDPDVEELALAYGLEKVVKVRITGANGEEERVRLYIENETIPLGDDKTKLQLVAMKTLGGGSYEFHVGPVNDIQVFAERIKWGKITSADRSARLLSMEATLPANLPSREELEAQKKKKEEEERAIWQADVEHRARPGEDQLDWIVRVIRDNDTFAHERALKALSIMDVRPERLEEVSALLIEKLPEQKWHLGPYLTSMVQWKTEKTEAAILTLGGQHRGQNENEALMQALVKLGSEKCALALASALPDFFTGDMCVGYLIEMGPIAEEPVAGYLKHQDAKVRSRVYRILAEIGSTKTAPKVRANERLEDNPGMKQEAADCVAAIKARMDAAGTPDEEKSK